MKTILGWLFNFRELTVYLPENKYVAWTRNIKDVLVADKTSHAELDTLIGRMVHVGFVISQIYYFMSRLRDLMWRSRNRRIIKLTGHF